MGKHPTQKPLALIEHFVNILSNRGDVVLDPLWVVVQQVLRLPNLIGILLE